MTVLYPFLLVMSVFCATVPMVSLLALVWWLDRYDREPVWLVGLTSCWGALGATLLSLIGNTAAQAGLVSLLGPAQASMLTPVVIAPLIEEPTKAIVLLLLLGSRHFDNSTDGFVYGAAAGLGFGMTENLLYFWQVAALSSWDPAEGLRAWAATVGMRTAYSGVLHATTTAVVGASLGLVRFRRWPARVLALLVGLGVAMSIHALWNGLLTLSSTSSHGDELASLNMVLFPVEVLTIFFVFQLSLWAEQREIRRQLSAEAEQGTLPAAHVASLSSYRQRHSARFVPPGVPAKAYIKAATRLALRRRPSQINPNNRQLVEETERLRREVRGLLALATDGAS